MKIDTKEIANGLHNGKEVWICDFRYTDFDNKPIRKVLPVKAVIKDKAETTKNIYYSNSFFGDPDKKSVCIPLFDNTGYRGLSGTPLQCFTTELECREAFDVARKENLEKFLAYKKEKLYQFEFIENSLR